MTNFEKSKLMNVEIDDIGSYGFCAKKDIPRLVKRAESDAEAVLKDFKQFFSTSKDVAIQIKPIAHTVSWSVGAVLTWDGVPIRSEDDAGLLFLSLNECVLNKMIKLGFPSYSFRERGTTDET